jgi:hypothetical protein
MVCLTQKRVHLIVTVGARELLVLVVYATISTPPALIGFDATSRDYINNIGRKEEPV